MCGGVDEDVSSISEIEYKMRNNNRVYESDRYVYDIIQKQEQANKLQEENNRILQQQVEQLKKQAEDLKKENELQNVELRKDKIFQWVSFGVSTVIAILALCVSIIGLFF